MHKSKIHSKLVRLSVISILAGFSTAALASGFQLFEANGAGVGDFYAGGAAIADDASTAYFNPAGLIRLQHQQIVLSGVNILYSTRFKGTDTWSNPTATNALNTLDPSLHLPATFTDTGNAQGGGYNLVPGFDYALPINDAITAGFSVGVPFGLETDFDKGSFVKYSATKTSVEVVDLSPAIGFKINDKLSLGVGIDAEHVDAVFDSMAGFPTLAVAHGLAPNAYDTKSDNDASGWGYGYHAGLLYQFTPDTRIGLAYRSKVSFTVDGTSKFSGPLAGGPATVSSPVSSVFSNNRLTVDTTLPASTMLSAFHQFNSAWAGSASVAYTEWGVFNSLNLDNVQAANAALGPEAINVIVPQGFRNSWRFAVGGSYQPCQKWLFKAGLGYDETPTVRQYRNVRLPDGDRIAAALGAHYQATKALGVDVGWTHLFFHDGVVNTSQDLGSQHTATLGKAKSYADLIGVQLTWDIV